jgi:hypothetical protein
VPRTPIRTKIALTALLAVLAPLGAASPAEGQANARLVIKRNAMGIFGTLRSSAPCVNGRQVALYLVEGNRGTLAGVRAAQPVAPGARTARFSYSLGIRGRYFARVTPTPACKGAQSRTIPFVPPPGT